MHRARTVSTNAQLQQKDEEQIRRAQLRFKYPILALYRLQINNCHKYSIAQAWNNNRNHNTISKGNLNSIHRPYTKSLSKNMWQSRGPGSFQERQHHQEPPGGHQGQEQHLTKKVEQSTGKVS